jgi:hypothetical protein
MFRKSRVTASALSPATLTFAAEAKSLVKKASEDHMDKIHACFSFIDYNKDRSALVIRVLGELEALCKELS